MSGCGRVVAFIAMAIGGILLGCTAPVVTLAILLVGVGVWFVTRPSIDPMELYAASVIGEIDAMDDDDEVLHECKGSNRVPAAAATECRLKFGLLRDTKANRLVVGSWLREWLAARPDMRKVDQMRHYPMALEACFVPTQEDVLAAKFRATRVREARVLAAGVSSQ